MIRTAPERRGRGSPPRRTSERTRRCLRAVVLLVAIDGDRAGAQSIWVEDFKDPVSGFDQRWAALPSETAGRPVARWESNGEVALLRSDGEPRSAARVSSAEPISWDPAVNRCLQVMVSSVDHGERLMVYVTSSAGRNEPHLLHDDRREIPGHGLWPQTFDVSSVLPPGIQEVSFVVEVLEEGAGDLPPGGGMRIDWMKAGMPAAAEAPAAPLPPKLAGPPDGLPAANPPTLEWSAPAGFEGNTYTVSYSRDPRFSDSTTVTILDGVAGTSYTPAGPLEGGTWYWTASATGRGRLSGPFLEKPAPADAKEAPLGPPTRGSPSFQVSPPAVPRDFPDFDTRAGIRPSRSVRVDSRY